MTGGWAATSTLRAYRWDQASDDEFVAALALVEAVLDAARFCDSGVDATHYLIEMVRENKPVHNAAWSARRKLRAAA